MTMTHEKIGQGIQTGHDIPHHDHRFFDPKSPAPPAEILGLPTDAVLRLGRSVAALSVLPPKANLALYDLPKVARIFPLLETMQRDDNEPLTPEDIRPYRKPIKTLNPTLSAVDKLAATIGAVGVVGPRRALNRRIEQEFPARATDALSSARENLESIEKKIESQVEFISGFDNPQQQFETEVRAIARETHQAIVKQRDMRVNGQSEPIEQPMPKGIAGFFTRAVRKVRNFFGLFRRKPEVNKDITAYDAGIGLHNTMQSFVNNRESTRQRLPMLSGLLLDKLPLNKLPSRDQLVFLAPEILTSIFSILPAKERDSGMLESVNQNPHEFRFVTKFKKRYRGYSLYGVQYSARTLLPAIRDVLPSSGDKVKEIFAQFKDLLQPKDDISNNYLIEQESDKQPADNPEAKPKKHGRWNLLRRLKSRRSKGHRTK